MIKYHEKNDVSGHWCRAVILNALARLRPAKLINLCPYVENVDNLPVEGTRRSTKRPKRPGAQKTLRQDTIPGMSVDPGNLRRIY